jgi:hypothetical protein
MLKMYSPNEVWEMTEHLDITEKCKTVPVFDVSFIQLTEIAVLKYINAHKFCTVN